MFAAHHSRDKVHAQRAMKPRPLYARETSQEARVAEAELEGGGSESSSRSVPYSSDRHVYNGSAYSAELGLNHPDALPASVTTLTSLISEQRPLPDTALCSTPPATHGHHQPLIPLPANMAISRHNHSGSDALFDDPELDEVWQMIFGGGPFRPSPATSAASPTLLNPSALPTLPENTFLETPSSAPLMGYLHHYLTNIMPLQFRTARSLSIGEMVGPLAFQFTDILTSVTSLAALHLAQKRAPMPCANGGVDQIFEESAVLAVSAHQDSLNRLRYVPRDDLAAEHVIVPALFAVSYYLFKGGISPRWGEPMRVAHTCLAAAFAASPELTGVTNGSP